MGYGLSDAKRRRKYKNKQQVIRTQLNSLGLCNRCRQPNDTKFQRCRSCLDKQKEENRAKREERYTRLDAWI